MAHPIPDVPLERLEQRLRFLLDRAEAHHEDAPEDILARACAATLLRDAACVALLMDNPTLARKLLTRAGHDFLALGLLVGASLVALADARSARSQLADYSDVVDGARQQWGPSEAHEHSASGRPMAGMVRGSPRQLLSMMQADWLSSQVDPVGSVQTGDPIRVVLDRNGGHPAGVTGLSIDSYAAIADWLAIKRGASTDMPNRVRIGMATVAATRAEHLRAAQKDSFHWRLLLRPAELIDLDTTILMFLALGAGMSFKRLAEMMRVELPMEDMPLRVAASLRSSQNLTSAE